MKQLVFSVIVLMSLASVAAYNADPLPAEFKEASTVISFSNAKYDCSYIIVGEKHLLTAAHCTDFLKEGQSVSSRSSDSKNSGKHVIEKIIKHAKYQPGYEDLKDQDKSLALVQNDIALIRLANPIQDYPIRIAPLVRAEGGSYPKALLIGNGHAENRRTGISGALDVKLDAYAYRNRNKEVIQLQLFIFEATARRASACDGDSGGGIFLKQNGRYELVATIATKDRSVECGKSGSEGLAVPVLDNLDWILPELGQKL